MAAEVGLEAVGAERKEVVVGLVIGAAIVGVDRALAVVVGDDEVVVDAALGRNDARRPVPISVGKDPSFSTKFRGFFYAKKTVLRGTNRSVVM